MIAKTYTFFIKIPAWIIGIAMFIYYIIVAGIPLWIHRFIQDLRGVDRAMILHCVKNFHITPQDEMEPHEQLPRFYAFIVMIPWHIAGLIIAAYFAITLGIPYLIKGIVLSIKNKEPIMSHAYNYAYDRYITSEHIFTL